MLLIRYWISLVCRGVWDEWDQWLEQSLRPSMSLGRRCFHAEVLAIKVKLGRLFWVTAYHACLCHQLSLRLVQRGMIGRGIQELSYSTWWLYHHSFSIGVLCNTERFLQGWFRYDIVVVLVHWANVLLIDNVCQFLDQLMLLKVIGLRCSHLVTFIQLLRVVVGHCQSCLVSLL